MHVGRSELEGPMLPHSGHFCITIQILASSLDHYNLSGHVQIHLTLGRKTGCGDSEIFSIPYHQNGCHGHNIRALGY